MSHFLTNRTAQIYQFFYLFKLLPIDDLPEHSPLTNSASTLTPTPSMLYPQIQNSPDLLLQIPTHPQTQNSISSFITTGREKILSTLSHFSPFSSITNPERKKP